MLIGHLYFVRELSIQIFCPFFKLSCLIFGGIPSSSVSKESACFAGDLALTPGWERSPREGNGNPLQYACLENAMDRGAWQVTVHGVTKKSDMTEHTLLRHQGRTIEYDCNLISRHKINSSVPC